MSEIKKVSLRSLIPEITGTDEFSYEFDSVLKKVQRIHQLLRQLSNVTEAQIEIEYREEFVFLLKHLYQAFEFTEEGNLVWKALNKTNKIKSKKTNDEAGPLVETISPEENMLLVKIFAKAYKELSESNVKLSAEQKHRCKIMIAMGEIEEIEEEIKVMFYSDMQSLYQLENIIAQQKLLEVYRARLRSFTDWRKELTKMLKHEKELLAKIESTEKIKKTKG